MLEKAFLTESRDCLSKKRLKESVCMSPKTRVATIGAFGKICASFFWHVLFLGSNSVPQLILALCFVF